MSILYRLPVQLDDKKSVVENLNTEKYWDPVGKTTFRGRPIKHTPADLSKFNMKPVLVEVNREDKTLKIIEPEIELIECEYKKDENDRFENKTEEDDDPEKIKLDQIKLEEADPSAKPPILHAIEKLDLVYSILNE